MSNSGTDETDSAPAKYSRRQLLSAVGGTAVLTGGGGIGIGSLVDSDLEGGLIGTAGGRCGKLEPGADLSGCDLSGKDLSGKDLREVNLSNADLEGANLERADLKGADLKGTNLRRVNLKRAWLWEANLEEADLSKANLTMAALTHANMEGANLYWANLYGVTYMRPLDFTGAKWVDGSTCGTPDCDGRLLL